jgi:hypothetical protein
LIVSAAGAGVSGIVLLVGGIAKAVNREAFDRALDSIVWTRQWSPFLGRAIPAIEVVVGLLLLIAPRVHLISLFGAVLLTAFAVFSAQTNIEECGCGPFVPQRSKPRILFSMLLVSTLAWSFLVGEAGPSIQDRWLAAGSFVLTLLIGASISSQIERRKAALEAESVS